MKNQSWEVRLSQQQAEDRSGERSPERAWEDGNALHGTVHTYTVDTKQPKICVCHYDRLCFIKVSLGEWRDASAPAFSGSPLSLTPVSGATVTSSGLHGYQEYLCCTYTHANTQTHTKSQSFLMMYLFLFYVFWCLACIYVFVSLQDSRMWSYRQL